MILACGRPQGNNQIKGGSLPSKFALVGSTGVSKTMVVIDDIICGLWRVLWCMCKNIGVHFRVLYAQLHIHHLFDISRAVQVRNFINTKCFLLLLEYTYFLEDV